MSELLTRNGRQGAVVFCALLAVLFVGVGGCSCSTNYEREVRSKLNSFFSKKMALSEFALNSPWRSTFKPENIDRRATVEIEEIDLLEVRLPSAPNGLEAAFQIFFTAKEPFQLKSTQHPGGKYTASGTMRFIETTRGIVIQDTDFTVRDQENRVVGVNYLPWLTAGQKKP